MSIMDIFKRGPAQPATPAPAPAAPMPADNANANQAAGANSQATEVANQLTSPLDSYDKLWQNDPNAASSPAPDAPLFELDLAKIQEAAKKANFAQAIPQELMQKAVSGDHQAFSESMNLVAQQVLAQSMYANTKMLEQAAAKIKSQQSEAIPSLVKNNLIADNLAGEPLFQHEATKPILQAIQQQLAIKHPHATAAEIAAKAKDYVSKFAGVAVGQQAAAEQKPATKGEWDEFYN